MIGNVSLLKLSLAYNKLTDLSFFASNTQLEELNLIGNRILTFPTLNLPNLRVLKMCHNALVSMGSDSFSQLGSLEQFRIGDSVKPFTLLDEFVTLYYQFKLHKVSAWSDSSIQGNQKLPIDSQTIVS